MGKAKPHGSGRVAFFCFPCQGTSPPRPKRDVGFAVLRDSGWYSPWNNGIMSMQILPFHFPGGSNMETIQTECVQTLRFLAADEVEQANSGHPGLPLGTAPLLYTFWDKFMKYNPADPKWFDRDRFILSPGHGSALLYAMLHLAGYGLTLDELKNFRQWGSRTPGHPEYGVTPGVDLSTGPGPRPFHGCRLCHRRNHAGGQVQ